MAGRFVRSSKYRHVFGTPYKKDKCYDNIRITKSPWESNMCDVNNKFLAVVLESQGGGAFLVTPLDKTGRFDINYPKVCGHTSLVMDLAWNPFDDNMIASSSEDCTVKIWEIPDGGLTENLIESKLTLEGHQKKVGIIAWHPTAEGVLASASFDTLIVIWNIFSGEAVLQLDFHPDSLFSMSWSFDGSLIATTCKDKKLRVIDPRKGEVISEGDCHVGNKPSKVVFCGSTNKLFTTGFTRSSERQYALWKPTDLSKPLTMENIDSASGTSFIFYDDGTKVAYIVGKGDTVIRYFEVNEETPYVHFLSMYQSNATQRGCGILPKRFVNFRECEVMRFYKLHAKGMVEPVSMTVPRKSGMFQEDIYPPCFAGVPALSADEWLAGANKNPVLVPFTKDGLGSVISPGISSPIKSSGSFGSGHLSKQSSYSSNSSGPENLSIPLQREPSPASITTSGDFDNGKLTDENRQLRTEIQMLKSENETLKAELKEKKEVIRKVRQLVI